MAFIDVRLNEEIERGATGGPRFNTTITQLKSGHEKRNINWERVRGAWSIGYGPQSEDNVDAIRDHFIACEGAAHSFRFKDWTDFEIPDGLGSTPQEIGTGDGVEDEFQIVKKYTAGATTYSRKITKIVAGSYTVYVAGVPLATDTGYSINLLTGLITFTSIPGVAESVGIVCEFDVPVRFASDSLDINALLYNVQGIPDMELLEVLDE